MGITGQKRRDILSLSLRGSGASLLFFVVLATGALFKPVLSCGFDPDHNYGDMTADSIISRGSDISLACKLHSLKATIKGRTYPVNSSMIRFTFKNEILGHDRVKLLNETAAEVQVSQATFNDTGHYYCFLDVPNSELNMTLVCASSLTVGLPPADIPEDKFKCISNEYKNLTCGIEPENYYIKTNYQIDDYAHHFRRPCPIPINGTTCMWTLSSSPLYRQHEDILQFRLSSSNYLGNHTQFFDIYHFAIIKPGPVNDLSIVEDKPSFVSLAWKVPAWFDEDPQDSSTPHLEYELYVQVPSGPKSLERKVLVGSEKSYTVEELVPFTSYVFSVRSKTSLAKDEAMWSEYANIKFTTQKDIPYFNPVFINDSYEVIKHSDTSRSLTIYWEPVGDEFKNAPGPYYRLFYWPLRYEKKNDTAGHGRHVRWVDLSSETTSYTFEGLSTTLPYRFKINSVNEIGRSYDTNVTTIILEEESLLPPKPDEVIVYYYGEERGYEIQWPALAREHRIFGYTVVWCKTLSHAPDKCVGSLGYKTLDAVPGMQLQGTYVSNLSSDANYHFAVSAKKYHDKKVVSSGLSWSPCVVPLNVKRIQKISEVNILAKNSTSFRLGWKLPCSSLSGVINRFQVTSCKVPGNSDCRDTFISGGKSKEAIVDNLEPNTKYKIELRANTLLNDLTGEGSDPITITTARGPPAMPTDVEVRSEANSLGLKWLVNASSVDDVSFFEVFLNNELAMRISPNEDGQCNMDEFHGVLRCAIDLNNNVKSFKKYEIALKACINDVEDPRELSICSIRSSLVTTLTPISHPGQMEKPHAEVINATTVYLSWKRPMEANGPLNHYRITIDNGENMTREITVKGNVNSTYVPFVCDDLGDKETGQQYNVGIQAVNLDNGVDLIAAPSDATRVHACLLTPGVSTFFVIGAAAAVCLILGITTFLIYAGATKFKKMYDDIKKPCIVLPPGLASQKMDLDRGDASGDMQRLHKQLSESSADEVDFKSRHGSGTSHSSSHSAGFCSNTSGHGSGTSPSSASSTGAIELSNIIIAKNQKNQFIRTLSEPTSETGESVTSRETDFSYVTQKSMDDAKRRKSLEVFSTELNNTNNTHSAPFVKQQNGYVTLPPNGNNTVSSSLSHGANDIEMKSRHGSGNSQSSYCSIKGLSSALSSDLSKWTSLSALRESTEENTYAAQEDDEDTLMEVSATLPSTATKRPSTVPEALPPRNQQTASNVQQKVNQNSISTNSSSASSSSSSTPSFVVQQSNGYVALNCNGQIVANDTRRSRSNTLSNDHVAV